MKFDLTRPCSNCPWRTDKPFHLRADRVEEIMTAVTEQDAHFACHKTTHGEAPEEQHCAGILILLERDDNPNQLMRIGERLGWYDRRKLDMAAPVFDSVEAVLEHYRDQDRPTSQKRK